MTEKRVAPWIEQHLWHIIAAAGAAYSGYLTGMMTIDARIDALERQLGAIEAREKGRQDFRVCTVRNIDRINDKLGIQPACPQGVPQ